MKMPSNSPKWHAIVEHLRKALPACCGFQAYTRRVLMSGVRRVAVVIAAVAAAACTAVVIQAGGAVAGTPVPAYARAATTAGSWRTAREVPGTAPLNLSGFARVRSVSCASAGNCSAGGFYWAGNFHPFVVSQVNGSWHTAIEMPGLAARNQGGNAEINSGSGAPPGNCSAGGDYHHLVT